MVEIEKGIQREVPYSTVLYSTYCSGCITVKSEKFPERYYSLLFPRIKFEIKNAQWKGPYP